MQLWTQDTPSGICGTGGAALGALKGEGVQSWPDDIIIYIPAVEGHLELVGKVLEVL